MSGPDEEDGDYAREFFDGYEREADRITRPTLAENKKGCGCGHCHWSPEHQVWVP